MTLFHDIFVIFAFFDLFGFFISFFIHTHTHTYIYITVMFKWGDVRQNWVSLVVLFIKKYDVMPNKNIDLTPFCTSTLFMIKCVEDWHYELESMHVDTWLVQTMVCEHMIWDGWHEICNGWKTRGNEIKWRINMRLKNSKSESISYLLICLWDQVKT